MDKKVIVVGAGLAGSEATYFLAKHGCEVTLYEMRPSDKAPAHHTGKFSELVCSNSLKSLAIDNAAGLLKEEMKVLDSLIMESALLAKVPAGQALAVDREKFADYIDDKIRSLPNVKIIHDEFIDIPKDVPVIIATGPLTSPSLSQKIQELLGSDYLYFYDAAAPLVLKESIDFTKCYYKSRYDKGDGKDYINCPFTKEEFHRFYQELLKAKRVELKTFEKEIHFEACMPIESIAQRGEKTLTFGPMKPKGLEREDGSRPYAVVQLRQDDALSNIYNIVGFQTNLTFPEQKRVFSMIPGLENATFIRYGVMHRNTFINSPAQLDATLQLRCQRNIFFAGQIVGVEGYIESACSGIIAAINVLRYIEGKDLVVPPKETVIGALLNYISSSGAKTFQPMNANYGVLASPIKDKFEIAKVSLEELTKWREKYADIL